MKSVMIIREIKTSEEAREALCDEYLELDGCQIGKLEYIRDNGHRPEGE